MKSVIVAVTGLALAISAGAAAAQTSPNMTSPNTSPNSPGTSPTPIPSNTPVPVPSTPRSPTPIPSTPGTSPVTVMAAPVQVHLKNGVIQTASGGTTLNHGFNTIDGTQRLSCTTSCTIFTSAMVQLQTTGNWAICAVVDGKNINPPCPFQGSAAQRGTYITGNSQQSWPVSAGTHTVQTQVFVSSSNSKLGNWQTTREIANSQFINSPGTL